MRHIDADKFALFIVEHLPKSAPPDAYDAYYDVIRMLKDEKAAPTIDVEEVKHGRWVFVDGYITCNCCGYQPYREHRHIDFNNLYKRCPECGAHMEKEKEE